MINRLIISLLLIVFSIILSSMFYSDQVFHKDQWAQESINTEFCKESDCEGLTNHTEISPSIDEFLASPDDAPIRFQPLILVLIGLIAVFFLRKSASDK